MCDIAVCIHAGRDDVIYKLPWDKRVGQRVEATIKKVFMTELPQDPMDLQYPQQWLMDLPVGMGEYVSDLRDDQFFCCEGHSGC